jgi:DNA-damage-inducible protein D
MTNNIFESIKKINKYGAEYWMAREFAKILEYKDFSNFENAIKKAMVACKNSRQNISDHFGEVTEMVMIGSGAKREFSSFQLSRYACYLIVQNSDPSKKFVALGQTYFAIQTRKQENYEQLLEDQKRIKLREEMKTHNKKLAKAADDAGVQNYGVFQNFGYMGLYGGLSQKDIHCKKNLKKSQKILDHMGSEELAANLFRATQAESKLRRENIQGQSKANDAHFYVGKKVRDTIEELGGTMPEDLPAMDSVSRSKNRLQKSETQLIK